MFRPLSIFLYCFLTIQSCLYKLHRKLSIFLYCFRRQRVASTDLDQRVRLSIFLYCFGKVYCHGCLARPAFFQFFSIVSLVLIVNPQPPFLILSIFLYCFRFWDSGWDSGFVDIFQFFSIVSSSSFT